MDPGLAAHLLRRGGKSEFVGLEDWVWARQQWLAKNHSSIGVCSGPYKMPVRRLDPTVSAGTPSAHNRSWLDETGASMGVQQKLMRHSDIARNWTADGLRSALGPLFMGWVMGIEPASKWNINNLAAARKYLEGLMDCKWTALVRRTGPAIPNALQK
jgi:hypothetical protein